MPLRLVMLGTGSFALPTFVALAESAHEVVGLVTQPDRTGRGHHHHVNPMKAAADERGIAVFQPERANGLESLERLREFGADLFVVAAYGQILSAELLGIPRLGAVNVHASLLPAYRGAAPIQYAVWNGETETGVTLFKIEPRLDAGPILGQARTPIAPRETSGDLETRLSELAVPLTLQVVDQLEQGIAVPLIQEASRVTRAPKLKKSDGLIDWSQPVERVLCQLRAMQPWPMPFTFLHAGGHSPLRMLILNAEPAAADGSLANAAPGALQAEAGRLFVRAGDGAIEVREVQPAGKRAMAAEDFLRGHAVSAGDRFGGEA